MSGWPDPDKPGVPLHPELDGRHWLFDPENNKSYPEIWVAEIRSWAVGDAWTPRMVAEMGLHYQGPVLTPAEADTLRAENARLMAEVEWLHGLMDGMITEVSRWSIKASEEMEAIYHARKALEVKP